MSLSDAILLSLAAGFLIIGIHQIITVGIGNAYWAVMLSVVLLFVYSYKKKSRQ
jgi:hypothetical protein